MVVVNDYPIRCKIKVVNHEEFYVMFNSTYFIAWMQKLLDSLETINVHNSAIVMENEKYHKSLPENTPRAS